MYAKSGDTFSFCFTKSNYSISISFTFFRLLFDLL